MTLEYQNSRQFYRYVLLLALPIMLQNGITNFVSLLDNIMVGRVGTEQMSGVAIVNQLMFVFNVTLFGATTGPGIFTSQFHGRGNEEGIRQTLRFKLMACLVISLLAIGLFGFAGTALIQAWLHDDASGDLVLTLHSAQAYLKVMLLGMVPFAVKEAYSSTLRETGRTAVPMRASLVAVAVNMTFNYILIFGKLGAPALGVVGAAIATVLSRFVECACLVFYVHRPKSGCGYAQGLYRSLHVDHYLIGDIFRKGLPLICNEALWSTSITLLSRCYSERGLMVVAAYNITSAVTTVASVVYLALGNASGIVMGATLGAGKTDEARKIAPRLCLFGAAFSAMVGLVEGLLSGVFPMVYNTTPEIRALAAHMILAHSICQPFMAVANCEYFILRSGGNVLVTMLFDSVYYCLIVVPLTAVLAFRTDLPILAIFMISQAVQCLKCVMGAVFVHRGKWVRNLASQYDQA